MRCDIYCRYNIPQKLDVQSGYLLMRAKCFVFCNVDYTVRTINLKTMTNFFGVVLLLCTKIVDFKSKDQDVTEVQTFCFHSRDLRDLTKAVH